MRNSLLFFSLLLLVSCKKDEDKETYVDLNIQFKVDSITFNTNGAKLYYKLENTQSNYKYEWISPKENSGSGSFVTSVTDTLSFSVKIIDSKNNWDTVNYFYDYRNYVIGKYKCTNVYNYIDKSDSSNHIEKTDTLSVSKSSGYELQIIPNYNGSSIETFKLNAGWSYNWTEGDGIPKIQISFFPAKDSISYYSRSGGLGAQASYTINGNKID